MMRVPDGLENELDIFSDVLRTFMSFGLIIIMIVLQCRTFGLERYS